jgi:hypothetical protein
VNSLAANLASGLAAATFGTSAPDRPASLPRFDFITTNSKSASVRSFLTTRTVSN